MPKQTASRTAVGAKAASADRTSRRPLHGLLVHRWVTLALIVDSAADCFQQSNASIYASFVPTRCRESMLRNVKTRSLEYSYVYAPERADLEFIVPLFAALRAILPNRATCDAAYPCAGDAGVRPVAYMVPLKGDRLNVGAGATCGGWLFAVGQGRSRRVETLEATRRFASTRGLDECRGNLTGREWGRWRGSRRRPKLRCLLPLAAAGGFTGRAWTNNIKVDQFAAPGRVVCRRGDGPPARDTSCS